jgi:phenylalanyl-tRNA synthetase beta chain|tara:strand:- start:1107 stop:3278 length:2172 start_codon:yes stop_codon:yes gene_type:complete
MRVPLSWVNEFVNIENINLEDLIEKLTLAGFEVEEVLTLTINNKLETILDLSATANRPDSLSIRGISQEIAAVLNKPINKNFNLSSKEFNTFLTDPISLNNKLEITNHFDSSLCSDFLAIELEKFNFNIIPNWLKHKLICCDIQPQNNINDLINFILLETGYPFEFYDLEKIKMNLKCENYILNLKQIKNSENILLENLEDSLKLNSDSKILGLYANEELISLAGIETLKLYKPNKMTEQFLIEGSIFNSKLIRQTSRKIGLRTSRSARYEKRINNSEFLLAISRLLELIKNINNQVKFKIHTKKFETSGHEIKIPLQLKNINEILGPIVSNVEPLDSISNNVVYLTEKLVYEYLTRLNFKLKPTTIDPTISWNVIIPFLRKDDITKEIDLIEEIGRLHGFNNFITKLPKIKQLGNPDLSYKFRIKLTSCFLNTGMNELINYSLVGINTSTSVKLNNPLTVDYANLRQSLLPKIIQNYNYNLKQGQEDFEGFEYGHVFKLNSKKKYHEKEVVSGILGNLKQHRNWNTKAHSLTWVQAKGKLELIFDKLDIQTYWKDLDQKQYENVLHPFRSATIYLKETNEVLGVFGQIHPIIFKKENLNSLQYVFELDFYKLRESENYKNVPMYQEYSIYPKIIKDISFIIDKQILYSEIETFISKYTQPLISKVELLDQYQGVNIPEDKISLCFKLTFQSNTKTLKTEEIDELLQILQKQLINKFDTVFRV